MKKASSDLLSLGVFNLTKENTMKTYNTYVEAKIANPNEKILTTGSKWSGDSEYTGKFVAQSKNPNWEFELDEMGYTWIICNPADYLMSLEEFFEAGHKFVDGDKWINLDGVVLTYDSKNTIKNLSCDSKTRQDKRFVLSAKALEEKEERVEWKNGDIAYAKGCSHDEIIFIGTSKNKEIAICECITENRAVRLDKFWVSDLLKEKPETPDQKKELEREMAIYDMCSSIDNHAEEARFWAERFYDAGYHKPE